MGEEVSGEASVGVIGTTARWLVPQLLTAVRAAHPRVQVIILEANTTSLVPQLVAGQIDLAVVNLPVDDPEIEATVLFEEELVLLADAATARWPTATRSPSPTSPATRSCCPRTAPPSVTTWRPKPTAPGSYCNRWPRSTVSG